MLYVFQVEPGLMTEYDMSLTLQSVGCLKQEIERRTKIPASSLVLLVSGGVVLQSDKTVSSYSAGTDTNPIYMFCKPSVKESHIKQSMCGDLSPIAELSTGEFRSDSRSAFDAKSVQELKQAVEKCCSLPATVSTLMTCATLAQQFSNLGHELSKSCAELVHEQHLQHQGWAAVVANLEDIYTEFCERSKNFKETFKKHRQKKEEYHQLLNSLNEVLEFLGKIPILPALQLNAEAHRFSAFDVFEEVELERQYYKSGQFLDNSSEKVQQDFGVEAFKIFDEDVFDQNNASTSKGEAQCVEAVQQIVDSDEGVTFNAHSFENKPEEPTLLHWILAKGNKASLQDILDYCQKGLTLIEEEPLRKCESELYQILEYANNRGLKQIKGIEDRLYGLDQLLKDVKKRERDQHDQAASLIQVRERFSSGSALDPSVLPTLAQSHWCQLEKLLKGHLVLVDIRRRITKSKEELSHILKARLETVLVIENRMSVQDAHSMLSFQCFHRLTRYFEIVRQLHRAPHVLMRAIHEVARRRTFSHAYLKWANDIAERMSKIYSEEVSRRDAFNAVFGGHFLKSLFPGLADAPSEFATSPPAAFDARLPCLTDADACRLADHFPHLAEDVPVYDMDATVKFFDHRLYIQHEERDADVQVDFEKDFESETETGDFERLSKQSAEPKQRVNTSTICVPETATVATVTEDNMDTHKINIEKLQGFLLQLCGLCRANILYVREEINIIKKAMDEQKRSMENVCLELIQAWEYNNEENEIKFREQTQRLTVDHELELSDMKATLNSKDDVIDELKKDIENLIIQHKKECERLENEHESTKSLLEKTKDEISALEKKIDDIEVLNQKEIKELQENMHMDYKAEIESLRSRFRLVAVTNMDRSPSESSLEKIERTDVIEINSHNAIVMQTKENAEVEKEEAVREALANNDAAWTKKFNDEIEALKAQQQASVNSATRRLLSEKDRQLELMREREQTLTRECAKYRDTIQQLTDPETNAVDSLLRTQVTTLENEKALLQQQVQELKKELEKREERSEEKSREDDGEGRSSQKEDSGRRSCNRCHTPFGLPAGTLSLSSCLPGHTVFIMWDPSHINYTVMQEAPIMFFVHSDCLPALDLSIQVQNESDRRLYAVATVESKEYCYAKRSGNRYRMPRGSRFYRVRVRPAGGAARISDQPPCCENKHKPDIKTKRYAPRVFGENRPYRKWLTYMHVPDMQRSVDNTQSTSSNTEEAGAAKVSEVATATLINLESPVSTSEAASTSSAPLLEEQPDSIEASEQWNTSRMQISTASVMTDMECSVARCVEGAEPLEVRGSAAARGAGPDELAQEAAP